MSLAGWLQQQWFVRPAEAPRRAWSAFRFYLGRCMVCLLLWPLHAMFVLGSTVRSWAYRQGWLQIAKLPVPVIVVGNLTVGGAGKTPVTLWLADQCRLRGLNPGIVSRGYGRNDVSIRPVLPTDSPSLVGDEPLLLAQKSGCPVWVGAQRAQTAAALLNVHPEVDVIVCDDGLQHLALGRQAEVVVFDGRGAGNGWRLPLGPLRDPLARLKNASAVVFNGPADPRVRRAALALPIFTMSLQAGTFYRLGYPDQRCTAAELLVSEKPLFAIAGIGHPARFFATLRELGLQTENKAFADHHAYQASDLAFAEAGVLLLTEKDAVKCAPFYTGPAWVLPVEAKIPPALADILLEKTHGPPSA